MNEYALITGASSGIGLAFAHTFAQKGHNLILVARSEDKLKAIAADLSSKYSIKVEVVVKDLSLAVSSDQLYTDVKKAGWYVKYLVNNAGLGVGGKFLEADLQDNVNLVNLNIINLIKLTNLFGKEMLEGQGGKILNVASIAAFFPGPFLSTYYASKSFVLSFTEALAAEYSQSNVSFTALCPGLTESKFGERAGVEKSSFWTQKKMKADEVTEIGYKALMKGQTIVIPGITNRIFVSIAKRMPRALLAKLIKSLF